MHEEANSACNYTAGTKSSIFPFNKKYGASISCTPLVQYIILDAVRFFKLITSYHKKYPVNIPTARETKVDTTKTSVQSKKFSLYSGTLCEYFDPLTLPFSISELEKTKLCNSPSPSSITTRL